MAKRIISEKVKARAKAILDLHQSEKITLLPIKRSRSGRDSLRKEGSKDTSFGDMFVFSVNPAQMTYTHNAEFYEAKFIRSDLVFQRFVRNAPVEVTGTGKFLSQKGGKTAQEQYRDFLLYQKTGQAFKLINRYIKNTNVVIRTLQVTVNNNPEYLEFRFSMVYSFALIPSVGRPDVPNVDYVAKRTDTIRSIAKRNETVPEKIIEDNDSSILLSIGQEDGINVKVNTTQKTKVEDITYIVPPGVGETLTLISGKTGVSENSIRSLNPWLVSNFIIPPGTVIVIGKTSSNARLFREGNIIRAEGTV